MKRFLPGIMGFFFSILIVGLLAAAGTSPVVPSLLNEDLDEVVIDRLPLDVEPVSTGLFQVSSNELDELERPAALTAYLASFTGLSSFRPSAGVGESGVRLSSSSVREANGKLTVSFKGEDLFPEKGEPVLTAQGQTNLAAACDVVAPHNGKPLVLEIQSKDVKRGQRQTQTILSFLSARLNMDSETVETVLRVDPNEDEEVLLQVLGISR